MTLLFNPRHMAMLIRSKKGHVLIYLRKIDHRNTGSIALDS